MNEHWLLTTSDREHGGKVVLGIFNTEEEAWEHYQKTHDKDERYWRIPSVECWINDKKIEPHVHDYEFNDSCGCDICTECNDHKGLARCYCGWSASGEDGRSELEAMGETIDPD